MRKKNSQSWYTLVGGMLHRIYKTNSKTLNQVVVPETLRKQVMALAHESLMGGHLGTKKTIDKIQTSFYWPGIYGDVVRFCKSCDVCQRTVQKGKVTRVPLEKMPIIDVPFKRVAVDLVGPIYPASDKGNRYILTLVDYATRYPEAVSLKHITTEAVAEGLVDMFSRLGVPEEILSDQGTQFMSEVMQEVTRLLSLKHMVSSPYHPICNGLCEKFNGVLKQMVKRLCHKRPKDWDRFINSALFAYREAPQESTGFAPFELLYGRTVRGPMQILKELWTKEIKVPEVKTSYQYVVELREKLEEGIATAHEALRQAQGKYKRYYDRRAKARCLKPGSKVLILRPTDHNKLLMQWKGPYNVESVVAKNDYKIMVDGKAKTYHINLLKEYMVRGEETHVGASVIHLACAAVIDYSGSSLEDVVDDDQLLEVGCIKGKETYQDVVINEDLQGSEKSDLLVKLKEFQDVMTEKPGLTSLVEHRIPVTTATPVRSRPYTIPYSCREMLKGEIDEMVEMGIAERADTPYTSPVVIVKKKTLQTGYV